MYILMLIVVFGLVFFSFAFVLSFANAVKNNSEFNGMAFATIIGACVTFLVFYFGG